MVMDIPDTDNDHADLEDHDIDTDDDFDSTCSTFVEPEARPDDNSDPQNQSDPPPPYRQPRNRPNRSASVSQQARGTPLCIVCHVRPAYSTAGRQFTTCGLACAANVNVPMCCVCGIRPSYSNGSKKYPTCDLECAAKLKSRASSQGGNSQTSMCIVCTIRPSYSNGPKKYPTCGRTCATKLTKLCEYCRKRPKVKNYPHCGLRCRDMAKSACLMCHSHPKNGKYHFCGRTCRENARKLAPLILEVPRGHTTFDMVENKFKKSWKAGQNCPAVKKVYKVVEDYNFLVPYDKYLKQYGNEGFRYHGTRRGCKLGDDGQTTLCTSSSCAVCSILKTSFQVSLANPGGSFGQGIYTSSASNKSAGYSSGVMFLTKVVMGKVYKVTSSARSCPSGHQSVVYNANGPSDETVVYTNEAIRPVFLIIFA